MPNELYEKLYREIKAGRLTAVQAFLDKGGDPNLSNRYGWSLLMAAAMKGNSRITTLLLDRGAHINKSNDFGETALALAAGGGFPKTVKLLLSQGASLDVHPHGQSLSAYMRYARQASAAVDSLLTESHTAVIIPERCPGDDTIGGAIHGAFPNDLSEPVGRVAQVLGVSLKLKPSKPFVVTCEGEALRIRYRIHHTALSLDVFAQLKTDEQLIAACWFTRHYDGHIREQFLRKLPVFNRSWVIAYVVALCGEYVVEMLEYIWSSRDLFDEAELGAWLFENQLLYQRIRSRMISYWDCYYRSKYPHLRDYVGRHLIHFFDNRLTVHTRTTGI